MKFKILAVLIAICLYGVFGFSLFDDDQLCADGPAPADKSVQPAVSRLKVALPDTARISEGIFGLPGLSNAGRLAPGVFRGAQPEPEGYRTLKKMGIRTVVNLRSTHSEREEVENAGMRSIEIPVNTITGMDIAMVDKVMSIITDPEYQPVFFHCMHGQDRTGIIAAIYRMDIDGWSLSDAEAEMQAFGFNDVWVHLKKFLRDYAKSKKHLTRE